MDGSSLLRVPRTLGKLGQLRELDMYTSYNLHYLPFEVVRCKRLVSSRFSTRTLFGNYKNDLAAPALPPTRRQCRSARSSATGHGRRPVAPLWLAWVLFSTPLSCDIIRNIIYGRRPDVASPCNWEECSVCQLPYLQGAGSGYGAVWTHRLVATDCQALLAFCCTKGCDRPPPPPVSNP